MKKIFIVTIMIFSLLLDCGCANSYKGKDIDIANISDRFLKGNITSNYTTLETEHFIINIDKNVYVPGYLLQYIEILYKTMEEISGLNFYNIHYNKQKIVIVVEKNLSSESEFNPAYAGSKNAVIHISSGDLLLGNSYTLAHELSHVLQYSNSSWDYSEVYTEGFAEYNSYKTIKHLEETNMMVAKANESSLSQIANMKIDGDIYSNTLKYWIENPINAYDIAINGAYAIGMRFMNYLDDVYGDYTSWINYYEEKDPYYDNPFITQKVPMNEQFMAMVETYGEEVFDGFYDWLKKNEKLLYANPFNGETSYDLTNIDYTYIYPKFNDSGSKTVITRFYKFDYDNLYIIIDETRFYLEKYKEVDVSNLKLKLSNAVTIKLYDVNNNLIKIKKDNEFSLKDVSYIKLVGKGTLGKKNRHGLEIVY